MNDLMATAVSTLVNVQSSNLAYHLEARHHDAAVVARLEGE